MDVQEIQEAVKGLDNAVTKALKSRSRERYAVTPESEVISTQDWADLATTKIIVMPKSTSDDELDKVEKEHIGHADAKEVVVVKTKSSKMKRPMQIYTFTLDGMSCPVIGITNRLGENSAPDSVELRHLTAQEDVKLGQDANKKDVILKKGAKLIGAVAIS